MAMDVEMLTHIVNTLGEEVAALRREVQLLTGRIDEILDWVNR